MTKILRVRYPVTSRRLWIRLRVSNGRQEAAHSSRSTVVYAGTRAHMVDQDHDGTRHPHQGNISETYRLSYRDSIPDIAIAMESAKNGLQLSEDES